MGLSRGMHLVPVVFDDPDLQPWGEGLKQRALDLQQAHCLQEALQHRLWVLGCVKYLQLEW